MRDLSAASYFPSYLKTKTLDSVFMHTVKGIMFAFLILFLVVPLISILGQAFNVEGGIIGLWTLLSSSHYVWLIQNSLNVSLATVFLVVVLAYIFAFAINLSRIPCRNIFRFISLLPLMAPSMLSALALIYLFGNQGFFKGLFPDGIYGFWGILLGQFFYNFPMALMIISTSMRLTDQRLYDAALSMGANNWKIFCSVTWPATRYSVFAACCLVFTQTITNFGIPVVIGGDYQVLAMEAYKSVFGQQNFSQGAFIGCLLLLPAIFSFAIDIWFRRKNMGLSAAQSHAFAPPVNYARDTFLFLVVTAICAGFLLICFMAIAASFFQFWPYNINFSWANYQFESTGGMGWLAYRNSLTLSIIVAVIGTPLVFTYTYLMEKTLKKNSFDVILRFISIIPMAVPGLVMGLGYVFFFNAAANPLNILYGSILLMAFCCIVRFFTPAQMTATTILRQLNPEIELASLSLKIPLLITYVRVTVPICLPAIVEIFRYLFVSAMTSVSALIFLYSPKTILSSIAILNLDDAGALGAAAALSTLVLLTSSIISLTLSFFSSRILVKTQKWQRDTKPQL